MKLSSLYEQAAVDLGIEEKTVKYVMDDVFNNVANLIRNRSAEDVLLHNFGTFYINPYRFDYAIKGIIRMYRNGKMSRAKLEKDLPIMWKMRRKIRARNGM